MQIVIITSMWVFGLAVLYLLARSLTLRWRTRQRVFEFQDESLEQPATDESELSALQRWLFLAGFQGPNATTAFVLATTGASMLGLSMVYLIHISGLVAVADRAVSGIPGGVGDIFRHPCTSTLDYFSDHGAAADAFRPPHAA